MKRRIDKKLSERLMGIFQRNEDVHRRGSLARSEELETGTAKLPPEIDIEMHNAT